MKKRVAYFALPFIAVFLLAPLACSDKSRTEDSESIPATDKSRPIVSQKAEEGRSKAASPSIKGGQELKMDKFTLVIPGDWKRNQQTDVWSPATEDDSNPLPDHYLSQGSRNPMMLNSSDLVEGIKTHIGADPQDIKMIEIGGMNGATCSWERGKYQYVGLFLQEKITGFDIPMLNFFILRAPKDSFPQYEKTYRDILNSVRI